ncbi:MAG TPA: ATP-binding protein [Allosphingosinicella sp.]|nr:ATP-binding protein [Allosphingosinicella sp.]
MPPRPCAPPEATITVAAKLEEVRRLTDCVRAFAEAHDSGQDALIDLELAVAEAANNIVIHGYDGTPGEITLHLARQPEGLRIELLDSGAPIPAAVFDHTSPAPDGAESGRGMAIIFACVDELAYESADGINRLKLLKRQP